MKSTLALTLCLCIAGAINSGDAQKAGCSGGNRLWNTFIMLSEGEGNQNLRTGYLLVKLDKNSSAASIVLETQTEPIHPAELVENKEPHLTTLVRINETTYSIDEDTEIVYKLTILQGNVTATPWKYYTASSLYKSSEEKFKVDWAAGKDDSLYYGSTIRIPGNDKNSTDKNSMSDKGNKNSSSSSSSTPPATMANNSTEPEAMNQTLRKVSTSGDTIAESIDLTKFVEKVKSKMTNYPGYSTLQMVGWSKEAKKWLLFANKDEDDKESGSGSGSTASPSNSTTNATAVAKKSATKSVAVFAKEDWSDAEVKELGEAGGMPQGFTSYKFVPSTEGKLIMGLTCGKDNPTTLRVFDIEGKTILPNTKVDGDGKYESLEFGPYFE